MYNKKGGDRVFSKFCFVEKLGSERRQSGRDDENKKNKRERNQWSVLHTLHFNERILQKYLLINGAIICRLPLSLSPRRGLCVCVSAGAVSSAVSEQVHRNMSDNRWFLDAASPSPFVCTASLLSSSSLRLPPSLSFSLF